MRGLHHDIVEFPKLVTLIRDGCYRAKRSLCD